MISPIAIKRKIHVVAKPARSFGGGRDTPKFLAAIATGLLLFF